MEKNHLFYTCEGKKKLINPGMSCPSYIMQSTEALRKTWRPERGRGREEERKSTLKFFVLLFLRKGEWYCEFKKKKKLVDKRTFYVFFKIPSFFSWVTTIVPKNLAISFYSEKNHIFLGRVRLKVLCKMKDASRTSQKLYELSFPELSALLTFTGEKKLSS